jgi:uncharacterized protein (TIGR03437 family)
MMKTRTSGSLLFALLLGMLLGFAPQASSATLLYAVTSNALLYRSADGAKTWQPIPITGEPSNSTNTALAVDPQNPSILYVAAVFGARKPAIGATEPHNFFRSTDGGATWSQSDRPPSAIGTIRLAVDPSSFNIVYLADTSGGFFRSTDSAATWSAPTLREQVSAITTDVRQPGVVYVGTVQAKVYKSADFGVTWTLLTSNPGFQALRGISGSIHGVAVDPNNSSILYAAGEGTCGIPATNCGLFQSTDGGKSWHLISGTAAWFKNAVIDPRNGNIYAAGVIPSPVQSAHVVKSTDGGKTWTQIVKGMSKFGAEVHLDPEVAANLYAGQANLVGDTGPGGGVFVSTDTGATWTRSPVDANLGIYDVVLEMAAVSTIVAPPSPPAISANGVVNAASFQPGIAPNSWVTIKGTNLAPKTDDWSNSIVNGALPTSLDGVSVSMGGKPAYIYFISPNQINVLAPDVPNGAVSVTVTNSVGASAPFATIGSPYAPAFFQWPNNQVVATRQDFSFAAKAGTFTGAATVPAKPGDVLILWGTGFGPTNPAAPAGVAAPGDKTYATATMPTVTINNTAAIVFGAALAPGSAGLYQVAIAVPNTLADGDWPIQAGIAGVQSPTGTVLTVSRGLSNGK